MHHTDYIASKKCLLDALSVLSEVWTPYWKEMQTEQDEYKCTGALGPCIDGPFDLTSLQTFRIVSFKTLLTLYSVL